MKKFSISTVILLILVFLSGIVPVMAQSAIDTMPTINHRLSIQADEIENRFVLNSGVMIPDNPESIMGNYESGYRMDTANIQEYAVSFYPEVSLALEKIELKASETEIALHVIGSSGQNLDKTFPLSESLRFAFIQGHKSNISDEDPYVFVTHEQFDLNYRHAFIRDNAAEIEIWIASDYLTADSRTTEKAQFFTDGKIAEAEFTAVEEVWERTQKFIVKNTFTFKDPDFADGGEVQSVGLRLKDPELVFTFRQLSGEDVEEKTVPLGTDLAIEFGNLTP